MKGMGGQRERVAFDLQSATDDGYGGQVLTWQSQFTTRAMFRYQRGGEQVEASRLVGQTLFKVRLRRSSQTIALTADHRMRDLRGGLPDGEGTDALPGARYNIREVDAKSDPRWVWIIVESGVAV